MNIILALSYNGKISRKMKNYSKKISIQQQTRQAVTMTF